MADVRTLRVLILSAGTQVGQNVLSTLASRRTIVRIVATSSVANEPALFDLDAVYLTPETAADPAGYERRLLEVMDRERIDLVIPCRDDDVLFLSRLRDACPALAPRLLCGSAAAAEVITDKWRSFEFSRAHGLPFAACLASRDAAAQRAFIAQHGLPLIAKPRRGYAAIDVYVLHRDEQVATMLERDGYIVQEYLGDAAMIARYLDDIARHGVPLYHSFERVKHSIQALIGPDGDILHVVCTRNVRFMRRSKWVTPDDSPVPAAIGAECARAFASAGWRGPLNVQCEQNAAGAILIHEFNGRFTGGTIDRWLLGHDEVGAAITAFAGIGMPTPAHATPVAREAFQSRVARAADPADVAHLAAQGMWVRTT